MRSDVIGSTYLPATPRLMALSTLPRQAARESLEPRVCNLEDVDNLHLIYRLATSPSVLVGLCFSGRTDVYDDLRTKRLRVDMDSQLGELLRRPEAKITVRLGTQRVYSRCWI